MTLSLREKLLLIFLITFMFGSWALVSVLKINMLVFNTWLRDHEPLFLFFVLLPLGIFIAIKPAAKKE
jgi:hypothetical protein